MPDGFKTISTDCPEFVDGLTFEKQNKSFKGYAPNGVPLCYGCDYCGELPSCKGCVLNRAEEVLE